MQNEQNYQKFLENNPNPRELHHYEIASCGTSNIYLHKNGKKLINFSSNNYLGIADHPLLIVRTQEFAKKYGVGSSSSRSVSGNLKIYEEFETQLAKNIGKPAALILATGYQTNISVLEALLDPAILGQEAIVFADRLCHVSMLANTRYYARLQRFHHNDINHLRQLLEKHADSIRPKFILVESIYSMDGDKADLEGIIKLAKEHRAYLYVDDAHSVGVYGSNGWGMASEYASDIDIIMGTFSKGLGSFGAYIGCSEIMRDYLVNKCKGLIYSTAISPALLGAISAVMELQPELDGYRQKLLINASALKEFFDQKQLACANANTHIIPWIIGDAKKTLFISQLLEEHGILGTTIRPPSVPQGKSRIRFCLSAAHTDEDIEQLKSAITEVMTVRF